MSASCREWNDAYRAAALLKSLVLLPCKLPFLTPLGDLPTNKIKSVHGSDTRTGYVSVALTLNTRTLYLYAPPLEVAVKRERGIDWGSQTVGKIDIEATSHV